MISVRGLTKRYGDVVAVDDLTFEVAPGRVTGFLGPNGAGTSTTMRMVLGLDRTTAGSALVRGRRYAELRDRELLVDGASAEQVGDLAHALGVPVHALAEASTSLEQAYLELTESSLDHRSADAATQVPWPPAHVAGELALMPGQLALLVLACVAVTSEYATGAITSTLQWTPR